MRGLEYGITLLKDYHGALEFLNKCQKRITCRILGVDVIVRNVVIYGMTNCPPFEIRSLILRSARLKRIVRVLDGEDWMSHALAYTSR